MQQEVSLNITNIIKIGWKWKKPILIFSIAAAIIMAIYALTLKNQYSSYANFYPASAYMGSRDNLFRSENQVGYDQFGYDAEVDHAMTMCMSNEVINHLIYKFNFDKVYGIDTTNNPKGKLKVAKKFKKNFKLSKGTFGNLEMSFTDADPALACKVVKEGLTTLQEKIRGYYANGQKGMAMVIRARIQSTDSILAKYTDSLIALREKYGVYDILSPSRKSEVKSTSRNAAGIELVQNLEELKDKYVIDRAKYEGNANEFLALQQKGINYLQIIQEPSTSGDKEGPYRTLMVLGAFFGAFFIALIYVFAIEYLSVFKQKFK